MPTPTSCVRCSTNKRKCDKKVPCASCVKAEATCIPTYWGDKRKRRRMRDDSSQEPRHKLSGDTAEKLDFLISNTGQILDTLKTLKTNSPRSTPSPSAAANSTPATATALNNSTSLHATAAALTDHLDTLATSEAIPAESLSSMLSSSRHLKFNYCFN
ncbi:hypothetical protein B0T14DRAFT_126443 [Immersiella caudata]|uniref:Zn(2)-C6 fungal-type domain-containing protein n=1 Tax=Immersiella caudata TaxID=314043 RepID=A0AA39X4D8_9PEZI|nr:hypothetical protein B0T14DRAFT_126443 [Immersiella caudata]